MLGVERKGDCKNWIETRSESATSFVKIVSIYDLGKTYSMLSLSCESNCRQYVSKWAWLSSNKTLPVFAKIIVGLNLAHGT